MTTDLGAAAIHLASGRYRRVILDFFTEKEAEGFSRADIDLLYAVELPLLLGYRDDGGRIRVSYDASIVERAGLSHRR
ncbi:hypothetical protein [Rhizobium leguminosarum]|uniref:hypothetical protein n=1 Tax=Rhizobium leguminosarum TaxID=384 RepID=UPI001C973BEF|nr:hypothetical protein [Rhizobium leguminosarum]MBY5660414.1 hypothetical protein [Rhizobium leguminosarum]MBY5674037.1 hypothetical protein [Rhizobium leguminosarum]